MLNQILEEEKDFANAFIDDVAVHSSSWSLQIAHLDKVLQRISDSGLKLNLSKCKFAQRKVKYLGHIFGGGTHTPDPEKLRAVENLIFLKTKRQMKSFIGLIS